MAIFSGRTEWPKPLYGIQSKQWIREPPIKIPDSDNTELIEANKLTLVGRVTNPEAQNTRSLVTFMPSICKTKEEAKGRDLGAERFMFRFQSEDDLLAVLDRSPYHYHNWMLVLQRWEPIVSDYFPSSIQFWIRIQGVPLHFWNKATVDAIGSKLGKVVNWEASECRVRVELNAFKPLIHQQRIQLPKGEESTVTFEYKQLEKHCDLCLSLTHEKDHCTRAPKVATDDPAISIPLQTSTTLTDFIPKATLRKFNQNSLQEKGLS